MQLEEPAPLMVPGGQTLHTLDPDPPKVPAGQTLHDAAPALLTLPAGQVVQAPAPPLLKVPAEHSAGQAAVAPDVALKQPALTALQLVAPETALKLPTGQLRHCPPEPNLPAGHSWQALGVAAPWPAGQTLHDAAPALLTLPAGQEVQAPAPPLLKVPAEHSDGQAEVAPALGLMHPADTAVQLVAPATALKVPTGHRLQVPVPVGAKLPGAHAAWASGLAKSSQSQVKQASARLVVNRLLK